MLCTNTGFGGLVPVEGQGVGAGPGALHAAAMCAAFAQIRKHGAKIAGAATHLARLAGVKEGWLTHALFHRCLVPKTCADRR